MMVCLLLAYDSMSLLFQDRVILATKICISKFSVLILGKKKKKKKEEEFQRLFEANVGLHQSELTKSRK